MSAFRTPTKAPFSHTSAAVAAALLLYICASLLSVAPALAEGSGPGWELTARTFPTSIRPMGKGTIEIDPFNVGAAASSGAVTGTGVVPQGLRGTTAGA